VDNSKILDVVNNLKSRVNGMRPEEVDKWIHTIPFRILAKQYAKLCTDKELIDLFNYWEVRKEFNRVRLLLKYIQKRDRVVVGLDVVKFQKLSLL